MGRVRLRHCSAFRAMDEVNTSQGLAVGGEGQALRWGARQAAVRAELAAFGAACTAVGEPARSRMSGWLGASWAGANGCG